MRLISKSLLSASLLLAAFSAAPAVQAEPLAYGPDTCRNGYVWRDAAPGDTVAILSNGAFGGIHDKLRVALEAAR